MFNIFVHILHNLLLLNPKYTALATSGKVIHSFLWIEWGFYGKFKRVHEMYICWIVLHVHSGVIISMLLHLFHLIWSEWIVMFLQVQSEAPPSAFRVKFHKCAQVREHDRLNLSPFLSRAFNFANEHVWYGTVQRHTLVLFNRQVKLDADPPQLTFFLLVHNMGPAGGTNLSQVAIRDSISGIVPLRTEGKVVERGYQTFAIDSLSGMSGVSLCALLNETTQYAHQ